MAWRAEGQGGAWWAGLEWRILWACPVSPAPPQVTWEATPEDPEVTQVTEA